MSRPKPPHIVRYTIRLNRAQGERVAALKAQLHARSDNEVFDYLVTVGTNQRDDLEQLVYSLFGNLADTLARRFQSLETVSQLHLALTDTFIKYALTALPEVPPSLIAGVRARATKIYEQVNLTAAREFQRRRESGVLTVFHRSSSPLLHGPETPLRLPPLASSSTVKHCRTPQP